MVCCLLCFPDEPIEGDPKQLRSGQFQITMMQGLYKNQPACCLGYICFPCAAIYTRREVLGGDMTRYSCCQVGTSPLTLLHPLTSSFS
jgi:hypothetical protein